LRTGTRPVVLFFTVAILLACLCSDACLKAIIAVAQKHKLVIISDEIYGNMTFSGCPFTPIAALCTEVPCISVRRRRWA
jgi:aspartate/methionine/tyrosine aminotransferase